VLAGGGGGKKKRKEEGGGGKKELGLVATLVPPALKTRNFPGQPDLDPFYKPPPLGFVEAARNSREKKGRKRVRRMVRDT